MRTGGSFDRGTPPRPGRLPSLPFPILPVCAHAGGALLAVGQLVQKGDELRRRAFDQVGRRWPPDAGLEATVAGVDHPVDGEELVARRPGPRPALQELQEVGVARAAVELLPLVRLEICPPRRRPAAALADQRLVPDQ